MALCFHVSGELGAAQLAEVVERLRAGGLAVVPTETVYGVVAALNLPAAVRRLREVKGRAESKPLQVLVGDGETARRLAEPWPPEAERLRRAFWPGPLTLVLPAAATVPAEVRAADGTVGLRWPAHALIGRLIGRVGPLAASSANRAGRPPAVSGAEANTALGAAVDVVVDAGEVRGGVPSSVVRLTGGAVEMLREGAITLAEVLHYV